MGNILSQIFPPKSRFKQEDVPDLTGKVMMVTGGNAGIGKETVKVLLAHNAKVYIVSRNAEKGKTAIQELAEATGKEPIFLKVDLSDMHSVKACAEEFKSKESRLDVLFNNGGVMFPKPDVTADGYDMIWAANCMGHWYLTKLLLPVLLETAKISPDGKARVVNVSSNGHELIKDIKFDAFRDGPVRKRMGPLTLYSQSKFGNVVVSAELARRYGDQGLVSTSLNPGAIRSELQRNFPWYMSGWTGFLMYPVELGALTSLYAGTSPEGANFNGQYLIPWARVGKSASPKTQDPELGKALWEWMESQVENI
ncbi:NAD(P)-binding protein [Fistulina hepatica ATCC 64428]|uniref:NAD(P)-binding protein n=1 Tax=Fistulina hepatica ATCC 64428 TaxID=1128425 RepID=A0A0D7AC08_9AGAR|nr:NAD(P)-binding protein [Fistulina hepatica ATCC 64428]